MILLLDRLWAQWGALRKDPAYIPIYNALDAGLKSMEKWYDKIKDTPIYFISHGKLWL